MYRSPSCSEIKFLEHFQEWAEDKLNVSCVNIIVGNFNINVAKDYIYACRLHEVIS